jgi:GntR family transcriptional regulator of arabinose operon
MKPKGGPAYMQIMERMLSFFNRQQYGTGDRIPTEHQLMEMFGVSRTTIRKTLEILEARGLITRTRGSGTFYSGKTAFEAPTPGNKMLGLVHYFFMDYIYTEIIRGIEDEAERAGYSLIIANSNRSEEKQLESIQRLIDQGVDGLIIEPRRNLQLEDHDPIAEQIIKSATIPIVTTHWGIKAKSLSTVTLDDVYAGRMAGEYLLSMGHRDPAYVYKEDIQSGYDRLVGFRSALEAAGLELRDARLHPFNDEDEVRNAMQGYLRTLDALADPGNLPDSIFYFNDNLAVQGYRAIAEKGLRIPEDISVLGFDDHSSASIVSPPLTTFEHPKYDLGRWVAKILIDEIEYKATALPIKLLFEPKLIERGSVRRR